MPDPTIASPAVENPAQGGLKPAPAVDVEGEVRQAITNALDAFGQNPSHVKAGEVAGVIVDAVKKLTA